MSTTTLACLSPADVDQDDRPLLLLDVDGVVNPQLPRSKAWRRYRCVVDNERYNVRLNPEHGEQLLRLSERAGGQLVWATSWDHHANVHIGPRLGLPRLPVITMDHASQWRTWHDPLVMYKTPKVARYVAGRPFVWFDDDFRAGDQLHLEEHPDVGEFLLIHVDPRRGLTTEHLAEAADWLAERTGGDQ
ncbi:HAD domain-containing protein [Sphaerisporangium aureirubrum]|uniref:HAD domain-containing protein n=1 Tax=Sphaerisporangium aureirubrum TaxID=1544736 RepID=A0ABW1NG58_9ACTN